ncbi:HepT-like ribonuclease domain-containing protein [Arhodomonas sp. SL1]|uniref:HepT-like ribonuclease domain-containing protein n=1 Tax=Arhodomonas sp. SL1 TaxID=3425691 RepID=UPI003F88474C
MQRDPRAYLWDAREAATTVAKFIEGVSETEYLSNQLLRSAVERQLEILGEALGQLEKVSPELAWSGESPSFARPWTFAIS